MNNSGLQVKAKAIDAKASKDKILYAGAALLVGLLAAAVFSTNARAQTEPAKEIQVLQIQNEIVMPFQLKSQKLSH